MIKKLIKWLSNIEAQLLSRIFTEGYRWAAGELLRHGDLALVDLYQECDGTDFGKGVEAAIADFKARSLKNV